MDGNLLYERLAQHCGHNVVIVKYGIGDGCYSLECEDCNEVICDTDCYDLKGKDAVYNTVFMRFLSTLPLNPPEIEIDGESKVREEVWTDGTEILCADEATAERIADMLDAIAGSPESHTGYYDPFEDAQSGEVDDRTGWWYVDFD